MSCPSLAPGNLGTHTLPNEGVHSLDSWISACSWLSGSFRFAPAHVPSMAMWPWGFQKQRPNGLQLGTNQASLMLGWVLLQHGAKLWAMALNLAFTKPQLPVFLGVGGGGREMGSWKLRGLIPQEFYNTSSSCMSRKKFLFSGYWKNPTPTSNLLGCGDLPTDNRKILPDNYKSMQKDSKLDTCWSWPYKLFAWFQWAKFWVLY